ncbi:hypothetical protein A1O7_03111 [Cladophialophora yegresii CBS 114405]|uniref:BTB domain-containing protein n=1 Tax=Cladophialophora yegresii CBS 114405 TaxID=1182544 RepID=W9W3Z0_9EURO|nr:uncharacterized protein A1O7_03111 [Cladophialophora yegresii CBS 114405]EXJ62673.1 hypothetical protein A1O7_03111 [Cladophialophora yegresii CBS 114405]
MQVVRKPVHLTCPQESATATIELPEDEPEIIERLIEYCYRADYTKFSANAFLGHAKVYAAAHKYGVDYAGWAATTKYERAASFEWDASDFLLSFPYIFESTAESVLDMRRTATECARSRMLSLTLTEGLYNAWKQTCLDVPEFAFDGLGDLAKEVRRFICGECNNGTSLRQEFMKSACCEAEVDNDPDFTAVDP